MYNVVKTTTLLILQGIHIGATCICLPVKCRTWSRRRWNCAPETQITTSHVFSYLRTLTTWHCPHSPTERRCSSNLLPAGPVHRPAAAVAEWWDGRTERQTDRQKDARQFHRRCSAYYASSGNNVKQQEAQLSPMDRAMRRVSWNLANCHTTVQKLLVRQVLHQVSAVANWPVRRNRAVDSAWRFVR